MNVGITRAMHALWILGNAKTLSVNEHWRALFDDARTHMGGCLIEHADAASLFPDARLWQPRVTASDRKDGDDDCDVDSWDEGEDAGPPRRNDAARGRGRGRGRGRARGGRDQGGRGHRGRGRGDDMGAGQGRGRRMGAPQAADGRGGAGAPPAGPGPAQRADAGFGRGGRGGRESGRGELAQSAAPPPGHGGPSRGPGMEAGHGAAHGHAGPAVAMPAPAHDRQKRGLPAAKDPRSHARVRNAIPDSGMGAPPGTHDGLGRGNPGHAATGRCHGEGRGFRESRPSSQDSGQNSGKVAIESGDDIGGKVPWRRLDPRGMGRTGGVSRGGGPTPGGGRPAGGVGGRLAGYDRGARGGAGLYAPPPDIAGAAGPPQQ